MKNYITPQTEPDAYCACGELLERTIVDHGDGNTELHVICLTCD